MAFIREPDPRERALPKMVENFAREIGAADIAGRLDAPAFHRNNGPLRDVLKPLLQDREGDILEIGAGTGQHAVTFASEFADLAFWPSDPLAEHVASIDAWRRFSGLPNIKPATLLDVLEKPWRLAGGEIAAQSLAGVISINVVHIAPWPVAESVFDGARKYLAPQGLLIFYGPFKKDGRHNSQGNADFDEALRARNPQFGIRDLSDLSACAAANGLHLSDEITMPANNRTLVFRRH